MAKKKSKKQFPGARQNNQPTQQEKAKQIYVQTIEKQEQNLLKDERIQEKITEYENLKEELEFEYLQKKDELHRKYDEMNENIKADYHKKLAKIADEKKWIEEQKGSILIEKQQMIDSIKAEEEELRRSYKNELMTKWEEEYQEKQLQCQQIVDLAREESANITDQARKKLDKAKEEAHTIIVEADLHKIKLLDEARKQIEDKYKHLTEEFDQKLTELLKKETEIKKKQIELQIQEEDFEFMKAELQAKRVSIEAKMELFSPSQVEKLNYEIEMLVDLRNVDKELIEKLKKEIIQLKQLIPENESRSVNTILEELESQRKENESLRNHLAQLPSIEELENLRASSDSLDNINQILDEERRKRREAEERAENLSIGVIELEQARKTAETLKTLNAQLQDELSKINDVYKQNTQSKFPGLIEIDSELSKVEAFRPSPTNLDLKGIVKYVRAYGAANEGLYYSNKTIRSFIASLASSKLLILQGLSGTGKSSLPRLFKEALGSESSLVPVQPSWRDNRELLGYDNDFTKRFKETEFTKFVYQASAPANRDKIWFIVLDEMNLARIEYYFADFLSILEKKPEEWSIPLIPSNDDTNPNNRPKYLVDNCTSLYITQNIWFIGTANKDESTFGITDKVYDRAQVLDFKNREDAFQAECNDKFTLSFVEFYNLIEQGQNVTAYQLNKEDWAKLNLIDEHLRDTLDITFGNRIKAQMEKFVPVYIACGGSKTEALDFLFAHKVLRKLESRYETYLRDSLKELIEMIELEFGKGEFSESISLIEQKIQRLGG
ncbi:AAA family ATPase [Neobacillus bataviensis]|uniref:AAA family ATPase n=1 Tax=Neobacillus bataviensis TaxID=220685 RepID=UPI001CC16096|nr:AAA family ATPase [Neobacillus bataviensis]